MLADTVFVLFSEFEIELKQFTIYSSFSRRTQIEKTYFMLRYEKLSALSISVFISFMR